MHHSIVRGVAAAMLVCFGCGEVGGGNKLDAAVVVDTPTIADAPPTTSCDPQKSFSAPVPLQGFATSKTEGTVRLSADELTLYVTGALETQDHALFTATRNSRVDPFGAPQKLAGAIDSGALDADPTLTSDERTIFFTTARDAAEGWHIYVATRASTLADFGNPSKIANASSSNAADFDFQPFLTADGQELWFVSNRPGGLGIDDIYRSVKTGASFGPATAMAALNSANHEWLPVLSADKLTIYLASNRTGSQGFDIWWAHRSTVNDGFPAPSLVPGINSASNDQTGWLSPDNCRLYMWSDRDGTGDVYVATRTP
jgi:Tol biopolymer transport system component